MTPADKLAALQAKLASRQNVGGYVENCAAICVEIARIEAEMAAAALAEAVE